MDGQVCVPIVPRGRASPLNRDLDPAAPTGLERPDRCAQASPVLMGSLMGKSSLKHPAGDE